MNLRSIPPQNRRRSLNTISSMRAATRTGFTFVGGQAGPKSAATTFQPKVVRPDPQKEIYLQAIQSLAKKLDELIACATELGEIEFWQARRNQLKGI